MTMDEACAISATHDLYGIGFRVGTYCQWLATLLSGIAPPSEATAIQTNTICFQCAVLAALILITCQGAVAQPEVLVVIPLAFGGFLAAQPFDQHASSALRGLVILHVFGGLTGYSLWFWWRGVLAAPVPGCLYYTFVFGRWPIPQLRVFGCFMSVAGALAFIMAEVLVLVLMALSWVKGGHKVAVRHFVAALAADAAIQSNKEMPRWRIWLRIGFNVLSVCYLAVMVELTLSWNPINGANTMDSVSQLVPLVIGATGLSKVLFVLLRERLQVSAMVSDDDRSGVQFATLGGPGRRED